MNRRSQGSEGSGIAGTFHALSWRARGRLVIEAAREMSRHRTSIIAAGVAFYALLALFPGLAALIAFYGLLLDTSQVTDQVASMATMLPAEAADIILGQLRGLTESSRAGLSFGALTALVLALWSASRAVKALLEALNFAFSKEESRNFAKLNGLALLLTLGGMVGACIAVGAVIALPIIVNALGLTAVLGWLIGFARWPILAIGMVVALTIVYRYGPCRTRSARIRLSAGAVIATVLWLTGSWLFSLYVENFGQFNETYGSLGAIVILLFWLLLSAYAILLGAEIDAQLARRNLQADDA